MYLSRFLNPDLLFIFVFKHIENVSQIFLRYNIYWQKMVLLDITFYSLHKLRNQDQCLSSIWLKKWTKIRCIILDYKSALLNYCCRLRALSLASVFIFSVFFFLGHYVIAEITETRMRKHWWHWFLLPDQVHSEWINSSKYIVKSKIFRHLNVFSSLRLFDLVSDAIATVFR